MEALISFFLDFDNSISLCRHMHQSRQVEISDEVAFFKYHDINKDGFWDEKELRAMYGFESDPDSIHIKSIIDGVFEDMDKNRDKNRENEDWKFCLPTSDASNTRIGVL